LEKQTEISQNAQFRAIQPSPSILSFVEDNVICMSRVHGVCAILLLSSYVSYILISCIMILDNFIIQLLGRRRLIELRRAGYNIELSSPLDNIPFSTSSERERIEENVCLFIAC